MTEWPDTATDASSVGPAPRATTTLVALALLALILFSAFVALGTWQIKRLHWKLTLIERVNQRVHAEPQALPPPVRWNSINAETDEYTRVKVSGVFLDHDNTYVLASTVLGRGYWLMTPLQLSDHSIVWINRGFVPHAGRVPDTPAGQPVTLTGLLRLNEPHGSFLKANDAAHQEWTSRDVLAMASSRALEHVAPFFIDAEAPAPFDPAKTTADDTKPVPGLTVVAFHNNHLVYTITWYALAFMVCIGAWIVGRAEIHARRRWGGQSPEAC